MGYDVYGVCECGYKEHAPLGILFHIHRAVCPKCGVDVQRDWQIKVLRWVSHAKWWNPLTWVSLFGV